MIAATDTIVPQELGNELIKYLATKPYGETYQLIHALQAANADTQKRRVAWEQAQSAQREAQEGPQGIPVGPRLLDEPKAGA